MGGFPPADIAVLAVYLVGITALGVWMARRVRGLGDYFMPRRFSKTLMVTFAFGTGTASDQAVSVAAETFRSGLSGIWWQWLWLPATPFYWLIAPIMRRLCAITTADLYALRYDRSVALLFAVVGVVGLSVKIGLLLKGSSALIDSATGGACRPSGPWLSSRFSSSSTAWPRALTRARASRSRRAPGPRCSRRRRRTPSWHRARE